SGRYEGCDRLAGGDAPAQRARRDVRRLELEPEHAFAVAAEVELGISGAGADSELDVLQQLVRLLPGAKRRGLVGTEDEDGVVEPAPTDSVDGEWMRLELDVR